MGEREATLMVATVGAVCLFERWVPRYGRFRGSAPANLHCRGVKVPTLGGCCRVPMLRLKSVPS